MLKPFVAIFALILLGSAAGALPPPPPGVQVVSAYGMEFSVIGNPGNRAANAQEAPNLYPPLSTPAVAVGAVGYEYAIARTEVTVAQWLEFANAYAPHYTGWAYDTKFASDWLVPVSTAPGQLRYELGNPAWGQRPVAVSWNYAARFVNWLSNGRGTDLASFESGVYDAATFPAFPGQRAPSPRAQGAALFMVSRDEWVKAAYYDPNRYGPGLAGYWTQPTGSDVRLIPGLPGTGAQTSAGIPFPNDGSFPLSFDILSYPHVQTPTGLFDISGSVGERTDTYDPILGRFYGMGTSAYTPESDIRDRLDYVVGAGDGFSLGGIRLGVYVPAPGVATVLIGIVPAMRRRR